MAVIIFWIESSIDYDTGRVEVEGSIKESREETESDLNEFLETNGGTRVEFTPKPLLHDMQKGISAVTKKVKEDTKFVDDLEKEEEAK